MHAYSSVQVGHVEWQSRHAGDDPSVVGNWFESQDATQEEEAF